MIPETIEQCNSISCSVCSLGRNIHPGYKLDVACTTRAVLIKRMKQSKNCNINGFGLLD